MSDNSNTFVLQSITTSTVQGMWRQEITLVFRGNNTTTTVELVIDIRIKKLKQRLQEMVLMRDKTITWEDIGEIVKGAA